MRVTTPRATPRSAPASGAMPASAQVTHLSFDPEHAPRKRAAWVTVVVTTLMAAALGACSKPQQAAPEVIRPVKTLTVGVAELSASGEFPGDIRPRVETRVGFRVAGKLIERQVEVGQRVRAGQVLARVDVSDLALAAQASQAQVVAAQTDLQLAQADFARFENLRAQGFISAAELERRKAVMDASKARLDQARAASDVQRNQAGYSTLNAPHDGVVTGLEADVGAVVGAGQPVVRMTRGDEREAVVMVPEQRVAELKAAKQIAVRLWADQSLIDGKLRELSPIADPLSRTYTAKITLINAPEAARMGMTVTALVKGQSQGTGVQVPLTALVEHGGKSAVWIVDPQASAAKPVPVRVGAVRGDSVAILEGLQPGQILVTAGGHLLQPGQKVRPLTQESWNKDTKPGAAKTAERAQSDAAGSTPDVKKEG